MTFKLKVFETKDEAEHFVVEAFFQCATEAIENRGAFYVALSGGSTPKRIYERIGGGRDRLDWSKVHLFWSDERCVPLDHPDSNYKMAMDAGFGRLPISKSRIHPFTDPLDYEKLLETFKFDLVLLGMGEDGHTASLFPKTHALHSGARLAEENFLPEKGIWRNTLTFNGLRNSREIMVLVFGVGKAEMVKRIMFDPVNVDEAPIIGLLDGAPVPVLVLDKAAAGEVQG